MRGEGGDTGLYCIRDKKYFSWGTREGGRRDKIRDGEKGNERTERNTVVD